MAGSSGPIKGGLPLEKVLLTITLSLAWAAVLCLDGYETRPQLSLPLAQVTPGGQPSVWPTADHSDTLLTRTTWPFDRLSLWLPKRPPQNKFPQPSLHPHLLSQMACHSGYQVASTLRTAVTAVSLVELGG